jgi:hypothetical protein
MLVGIMEHEGVLWITEKRRPGGHELAGIWGSESNKGDTRAENRHAEMNESRGQSEIS